MEGTATILGGGTIGVSSISFNDLIDYANAMEGLKYPIPEK